MAHDNGGDDVKLGGGDAGGGGDDKGGGGGGAAAPASIGDSVWGSSSADAAAALAGKEAAGGGDDDAAAKAAAEAAAKAKADGGGGDDDAAKKAAEEAEAKSKAESEAKAKADKDAADAKAAADKKAEDERRAKLTPEERAAEDKAKAEAEAKAKADKEAADKDDPVPEGDYDVSKFTAPDGIEYDAEELKTLAPVLKEFGLGHKRTQKLLDSLSTIVLQRAAAGEAQAVESYKKLNADWHTSCIADAEIGGSEEAHTKFLGLADIGLQKLGTPELRKFLKDSRAGNNPELIRFAGRVGKLFLEDGADPTDPKQREAALKRGAPNEKAKSGPNSIWG